MNPSLVKFYRLENDQYLRLINSTRDMVSQMEQLKIRVPGDLRHSINNLVKYYNKKIEKNNDKIKALTDKLNKLDGLEAEVLKLRYLDGLIWETIADRLYISVKTAHRYHKKALKKLEVE